ncbi:uncharacterized protein LOC143627349 isoform X2 [Bidens hawaiensis]|uniref:uncharacterized protein LOC143627349 isoform X2 n=1 Tax=Bidens hawaiensis TaxID=980011 RepID=UPI00404B544C
MTLDDFFTSTELKDGLTTTTRVNELINVLQNEKENIVTNVNDSTTRQWSAVATAIAATKNQECLDLFIQLDGLWFIDKWLNDALKVIKDNENGGFDDVIIALLTGLERLHVDRHQLVGSGIGLTLQGYIGHSSLMVREKAKDLCDTWARLAPTDVDSVDISPSENTNNIENVEQTVLSDTVKQETDKAEMNMESETEIITGEKNESKSEDVKETPEVDRMTTLTSDTDVDHGLESITKTETMEDVDKDEEMAEIDTANGSGGGLQESGDGDNIKQASGTESGDGDNIKPASGTESGDGDNIKPASGTESDGDDADEKKDVGSESEDDSGNRERFSKRPMKSQDEDLISKRPSDMELDYGMVDPLELARQVANEVELEVDSQEQSCSSTTSEKGHHSSGPGGPGKEVSSGPGPSTEPDIPASQVNETGQLNPEKGFSGFDLNQEVSSDEAETDCPVDQILTTPISVVSASRAAAADGPPVAPLQFEGALGWKGSAATSAFRRIPEGEKAYSPSSSQRLTQLDFDLNVAESGDDKVQDFLSRNKAESSSRLELDLNSLSDGDAGIISLDWKLNSRVASTTPNGAQSQSYNNIDLNLNNHLTSQHTASFNNPFLGKPFNNKRDEPVFSLFGTQVEANRNEYILHPPQPTNGIILEPSVDFSLGRPGSGPEPGLGFALGSSMPYPNLPAYSYSHNGYTMGPMYAPPPSAPIPYMVDSRGAPIIPQIPPAFSQPTQPFFFNMGANGVGPSRTSLDLNPGFITEMGNRENNNINNNVGLRQFFNPNQASSSSSVIGGKREEPDSGWELFPMNYKHQQPPWH